MTQSGIEDILIKAVAEEGGYAALTGYALPTTPVEGGSYRAYAKLKALEAGGTYRINCSIYYGEVQGYWEGHLNSDEEKSWLSDEFVFNSDMKSSGLILQGISVIGGQYVVNTFFRRSYGLIDHIDKAALPNIDTLTFPYSAPPDTSVDVSVTIHNLNNVAGDVKLRARDYTTDENLYDSGFSTYEHDETKSLTFSFTTPSEPNHKIRVWTTSRFSYDGGTMFSDYCFYEWVLLQNADTIKDVTAVCYFV